ncbi:hypothetical protein SKAU_G00280330 [Synaphobranchus kaupii]|uniref:Uncharacterized protein n=1 Tax=Synaphobranchus kaupii TaxID=118154 RepID=A0A9Q1EX41_SYNKA|nr:hypothetical protein SKAU_G00280330 [Synaphobranchus kaupii]
MSFIVGSLAVTKEMSAQVKMGEVGDGGVSGGHLHLNPLADSSKRIPEELPPSTEGSLMLAQEPSKPAAAPKPRLTAKPFSVQRNASIRSIAAPKPFTKPSIPSPHTSNLLHTPGTVLPNIVRTHKTDPLVTPKTILPQSPTPQQQEDRAGGVVSVGAPHQVEQENYSPDEQGPETTTSTGCDPHPTSHEPLNPSPVPCWSRRPLAADLTSKFESASRQAFPRRSFLARVKAEEGRLEVSSPEQKGSLAMEGTCQKKGEDKEREDEKTGGSIKNRIILLLDSASSDSARARAPPPEAEPHSAVQPIAEKDISVGVKQRIKELTAETLPTESPSPRPAFKPRPLSQDLTK